MKSKQTNQVMLTIGLLALALTACSPQKATREIASVQSSERSGIIGGQEVSAEHSINKSIVAVYDSVTKQLCTGSLLPNNVVLTAAHCLGTTTEAMFVLFGQELSAMSERRQAAQMKVHPVWQYQIDKGLPPIFGDVALIQFKGSLPAGYEPVTFLKDVKDLQDGAEVILAGYGISEGVKKEGAGILRQTTVTIAKAAYNAIEVQVDQTQGTGACHGDSGGPAYLLKDGEFHLWGITSRGSEDPDDHCAKFAIYTNALAFKKWITDTAAVMLLTPPPATPPSALISAR